MADKCHGPGCKQVPIDDEFFCGEMCQARWHSALNGPETPIQAAELALGALAREVRQETVRRIRGATVQMRDGSTMEIEVTRDPETQGWIVHPTD